MGDMRGPRIGSARAGRFPPLLEPILNGRQTINILRKGQNNPLQSRCCMDTAMLPSMGFTAVGAQQSETTRAGPSSSSCNNGLESARKT